MMQDAISTPLPSLFLFGVAVVAGGLNGVAGGGGLLAFPALMITGVPAISANATNTAALWVGTTASTIAYRQELSSHDRLTLWSLSGVSVLGGMIGASLLLHTAAEGFATLVPYLLLVATLLFAFSRPFIRWVQGTQERRYLPFSVILLLQLLIAIYGGFFGGGAGILLLAALEMMGMKNVHVMNAFKSWLATCHNAAALLLFVFTGAIAWIPASLMAIGALGGGYGAAYIARQIPAAWVRGFIVSVGAAMTSYFFFKQVSLG